MSPWLLRKSSQKLPLARFPSPSPSSSIENKPGHQQQQQRRRRQQKGSSSYSDLGRVCHALLKDVRILSTCIEAEILESAVSKDEANGGCAFQVPNRSCVTANSPRHVIEGSHLGAASNARILRNVDDEFEEKQRDGPSHVLARRNNAEMDGDSKAEERPDFGAQDAEMVPIPALSLHDNANAIRVQKLDRVRKMEVEYSNIEDAEGECKCGHPRGKNATEIVGPNHATNAMQDAEMVCNIQEARIANSICSYLSSNRRDSSAHMTFDERTTVHLSDVIVAKVIVRLSDFSIVNAFFQWACARIGYGMHSCHAYLVKLGEQKQFDQMWELLDLMKTNSCLITSGTFRTFIKVYGRARQPDMAIDAFKRAVAYNPIIADIGMYGELLRALSLSGLFTEARLWYSQMLKDGLNLDAYALSSLIRGFAMSSDVADAKTCFNIMLKEGLKPDIFTHNALIEGLCKTGALTDAMETFSAIGKNGLKPVTATFNILIETFCKAGKLDYATDLFSEMRKTCLPDRSTFNVLLQGLVSNATSVGKAMEFFTLMESEGWADTRSFIYLSNGLRQAEQTQEMHAFLKALFTKHGYTNQEVCLAHLHNLCHLGSIGEAEEVFTSMVAQTEGPNMPAYATMISAYCRLEKYDDAMELFEQLRLGGQKPSSFCYTPLIGAMLKKKRISNAMRYFEEMVELGIEVNGITCNLLLEELCEQGMVQDASAVVRTMLANKLTIRSEVLFLLMKCFYMQQKGGDADSLFLDMARMHCLPHSNGVLQTMGVMEKMGLHAH